MQQALLFLALLLVVAWIFVRLRSRKAGDDRRTDAPAAEETRYHAVSIKIESNACDAAKEMAGRRFLSTAAPRLPLPDCNALECRCKFAHHKDRRAGQDRRSPFAAAGFGGGTGKFKQERREKQDRRHDADLDEF